jgi:hypothetical protein
MNNIKIRFLVREEGGSGIKKLPSKRVKYIPRVNDQILLYGKDYIITKVYRDLELDEDEVVLEIVESKIE